MFYIIIFLSSFMTFKSLEIFVAAVSSLINYIMASSIFFVDIWAACTFCLIFFIFLLVKTSCMIAVAVSFCALCPLTTFEWLMLHLVFSDFPFHYLMFHLFGFVYLFVWLLLWFLYELYWF
jgi:hypothetical protein